MQKITIKEALCQKKYPGRGIFFGRSLDGKDIYIAYFIMGRSENSRNRILKADGLDIKTEAFNKEKMKDPSLIIYTPLKTLNNIIILTNGDQTDTISDFLLRGKTFEDAINTRDYEPDKPNYTPRISGIVDFTKGEPTYKLSIIKAINNNEEVYTERHFFNYEKSIPGMGHLIHTYKNDGEPLPPFCGEPIAINIKSDFDSFVNELWACLNFENKVSLFARKINIDNFENYTKIINKNEE